MGKDRDFATASHKRPVYGAAACGRPINFMTDSAATTILSKMKDFSYVAQFRGF